jgi:hypothetical protein
MVLVLGLGLGLEPPEERKKSEPHEGTGEDGLVCELRLSEDPRRALQANGGQDQSISQSVNQSTK